MFYACFLRINNPTMAIAMIITIIETAMYIIRSDAVAALLTGADVGAGDEGAELAYAYVSAYDP